MQSLPPSENPPEPLNGLTLEKKNLAAGVNQTIADFDWAGNGARIGDLAKGLLDTISTFLEQTDWRKLGESIRTFVVSIDWTGIVNELVRGFGAAAGALGALIGGLIGDAIKDAKKNISKRKPKNVAAAFGKAF